MQVSGKKTKPVGRVKGSTPPKRPLIFISHDSRDAKVAELFRDLLRSASKELEFFFSSDRKGEGIEFGVKWYEEVIEKIKSASEVVCLLTPRSLYRPWIFYEAGMAVGQLETKVLGVALGVPFERILTSPFGQFQNCAYDEDSLTTLVIQLVKHVSKANPDRTRILRLVRLFTRKTSRLVPEIRDPALRPDFEGFLKLGMYRVDYKLAHDDVQRRLARSANIRVLKTWFPETRVIGDGLATAIKRRAKVRLLLCKPDSVLLQQRSRTALKNNQHRASKIVYKAIKDINDWIKATPRARVEIRCYDSWPGCPVIWYDKRILMGFYFRRDSSPEWPWISVKKTSELATILDNQFYDLWALADNHHLKTQKERDEWLRKNKKWDVDDRAAPGQQAKRKSLSSKPGRKAKS